MLIDDLGYADLARAFQGDGCGTAHFGKCTWVRDRTLVSNGSRTELYDLDKDPLESENLIEKHPERAGASRFNFRTGSSGRARGEEGPKK